MSIVEGKSYKQEHEAGQTVRNQIDQISPTGSR